MMALLKQWASRIAAGVAALLVGLAWYYRKLARTRTAQRDTARRERDTVQEVRKQERQVSQAQHKQRQENTEHERNQDRSTRPEHFGDSRMRDKD